MITVRRASVAGAGVVLAMAAAVGVALAAHAVAGLGRAAWIVLVAVITAEVVAVILITRAALGRLAAWQTSVVAGAYFWVTYVARPVQLLWRGGTTTLKEQGAEVLPHGTRVLEAAAVQFFFALVAYMVLVRRETPRTVLPHWAGSRRRAAVVAALAVAFAGLVLLAGVRGGIVALLETPFNRRHALAGHFYVVVLLYFLPAAAMFVMYDAAVGRVNLWVALAVGGVAALVLLPLGGRGELITLTLGLAAIWQLGGRRVRLASVPIGIVAGALVVSGGLALRIEQSNAEASRTGLAALSLNPLAAVPRALDDGFTNFDRLAFALPQIPGVVPYQGLGSYARLLAAPIPRSMWAGKPGITEANVTAPLFSGDRLTGESTLGPAGGGWLEAGWVGEVFTGLLAGALWALLAHLVAGARTVAGRVAAVAASLQLLMGFGNLDATYLIIRVAPIAVLGLLLHPRSPAAASTGRDG